VRGRRRGVGEGGSSSCTKSAGDSREKRFVEMSKEVARSKFSLRWHQTQELNHSITAEYKRWFDNKTSATGS